MSCDCQDAGEQLCSCCTGVTQLTPALIVNRPALSAIAYRVGTYPTFRATMEAALSGADVAALAGLRTRSSGDFSIALIDAWSEVLDILTFYTERLANEAYLGTAIETRSVFELARLIGYKPSPGVSASAVLAYSLAAAPGSPTVVGIPAGTRVQSVPGPGQSPAVFETAAALTATIANNAIPAATSQPWQLNAGDTSTWIAGTSNNIQVGNALLFVAAPNGVPSTSGPAAVVYVTSTSVDPASGNTMITWNAPLPTSFSPTSGGSWCSSGENATCLYLFTTKAALYGVNAPVPGMFATTTLQNIPPYGTSSPPRTPQTPSTPPTPPTPLGDWPWQYTDGSYLINLDNSYPGLNPAASGAGAPANQSQWMVLTGPSNNSSYPNYTSFFQIESVSEANPHLYALSAKTAQLTIGSGTVLPGDGDTSLSLNTLLYLFVQETRTTTAYVGSQLLTFANLPLTTWPQSGTYPLVSGMLRPTWNSSIVLVGAQIIPDNAPVGVSGKRARIAPLVALTGTNGGFTPAGATSALPVSINQPFLVDAFPPVNDPNISGNLLWTVLTVTGQSATPTPQAATPTPQSPAAAAQSATAPGQAATATGQAGTLSVPASVPSAAPTFQLLPSATTDPLAAEAALVFSSAVNGATTTLTLVNPLQRIYDTSTFNVNANTVKATHGETVMEIMGSGDATNAALKFQLKQSPLTYTAAATNGGVQSTLQVRVNNLLWTEMPNFLSSGPADRVYVTTPVANVGPMVQFGNGIQGSRTPTGVSNIQATYRKGIGFAGMVTAGQLTIPLDRPQGLQSVTNPSPATGGADPSTAADARISAPLPTLTLGRIVSLVDYQNYALGFAGIALALATWTWFGNRRGIFLTLAGVAGTTLDASDPTVVYLLQAYQNYGLPNMPVLPVSYVPQNFEIGMQVMVDVPTYVPDLVTAQVGQSLSAAFAFGQLAPGQSVAASQVIQIAQDVPGVTAVNLTAFNLSGAATGVANMLCANGPIPASSTTQAAGAQVLLLDPASERNVAVWS
jgi:predicted phage baseplate assembly protein